MKIEEQEGFGITSTSIIGLNSREMYQLRVLKREVAMVLDNHATAGSKKEYLSDNVLKRVWAVLQAFTGDDREEMKSAFDEALEKEELRQQAEVG